MIFVVGMLVVILCIIFYSNVDVYDVQYLSIAGTQWLNRLGMCIHAAGVLASVYQ